MNVDQMKYILFHINGPQEFVNTFHYLHPKSWLSYQMILLQCDHYLVHQIYPNGLLNAIQYTTFLCPSNDTNSSPVNVSHTLHVRS
jgi:hypothetical protein